MPTLRHYPVILLLYAGAVMGADSLEERIQHAENLNVTAPWRESRAVLDALQDELDGATRDQRTRVELLRIRNTALAGRTDEALERADQLLAMEIAPRHRLRGHELKANIALVGNRFEQAFGSLYAGLGMLEDLDIPARASGLLSLAAYFHIHIDNHEQAMDYADRAVDIARSTGQPRDLCLALNEYVVARIETDRFEAAAQALDEQFSACLEAEDPVFLGIALLSHGDLMHRQGRYQAAVDWINKGIEQVSAAGYRDGVLNGRYYLARSLSALGRNNEATELLTALVDRYESKAYWERLRESHALLAELAERGGDLRATVAHLKAAREAQRRFLDRDAAMRLGYLRVRFDTRIKEQRITLLEQRDHARRLEAEANSQMRMFQAGGILALAIIGILLLMLLTRTRADRRRFRWLSEHDGLTGLYNHTRFFSLAREALITARENGLPYTLVIADIDYFKRINDTYGHMAGDAVLSRVGQLLEETFDHAGVCGRIGGEEFAVYLPASTEDTARLLIDRFRAALEAWSREADGMRITMSFGLARARPRETLEQLRKRADRALYNAKRDGRNQVVSDPLAAD